MGWWEFFHISARTVLWQETQVSTVLVALSCAFSDLKAWMLWQLTQDRPRLSWTLPCQKNWLLPLWQLWQSSDCCRADHLVMIGRFSTTSGSSTCLLPGPWQVSQPWTDRPANTLLPCGVLVRFSATSAWQEA